MRTHLTRQLSFVRGTPVTFEISIPPVYSVVDNSIRVGHIKSMCVYGTLCEATSVVVFSQDILSGQFSLKDEPSNPPPSPSLMS